MILTRRYVALNDPRIERPMQYLLAFDAAENAQVVSVEFQPRVTKGKAGSFHGNSRCKVPSASDY
jgi:hypothetical protein